MGDIRKDNVDLADCKKYDVHEASDRKRKATDFYHHASRKNKCQIKQPS